MKKIIISLVAILIFKIGFSQNGSPLYPITQNLGSSSSLVDVKGGQRINGAFVLGHFVDTAAANEIPYVKNFANGLITTDTSLVWLRSYDAKKWLLMPTQGRIVNGDSINYLVDVNRPPGQLNVYGKFFNGINAYSRLLYTDSIGSGGGSSYTFPYSVKDVSGAVQLENDTTANPANYFYGRNSAGRRGWYPQSGITGVNIYNSDGTFTGYRTVNGNYNGFEMSNISSLNIGIDDNAGMTGGINIGGDNADNDYHIRTIGSVGESGIYGYRSENKLYSVTAGSDSSFVQTDGENGISIKAFDGSLKIPLLNYTLSTTGKKIMLRDTATGDVWNIDPALIGGMTNPMTSTGDIIYSSDGSGTPARLAAGTNGNVLTLAAGVPTWAAGSGGGIDSATVRDLRWKYRNTFERMDDFIEVTPLGWLGTTTGSGASALVTDNILTNVDTTYWGVVSNHTGTTTTGKAISYQGNNGSGAGGYVRKNNNKFYVYEIGSVWLPVLSDSTGGTEIYFNTFGLIDWWASTNPTTGIQFIYDREAYGNYWAIRSDNAGSVSTVVTTIPIVAATKYTLRLEVTNWNMSSSGGSIRAFINDTEVIASSGTYPIVSNLPQYFTTNFALYPSVHIEKRAGTTNRIVYADWVYTYAELINR